jgi:hypothetical protein
MVWFKVDDGFITNRKVLAIPEGRRLAAVGVWLLAGTWVAKEMTDGYIPAAVLRTIPGAAKYAPDLVTVGLWIEKSSEEFGEKLEGFQFHDWQDYQPSKAKLTADRAGIAARQQAYRDRKQAEKDEAASRQTLRVTNGAPNPNPYPNRSSYGTTTKATTRRSAPQKKPAESTATRRIRDAADALAEIHAEQTPPPEHRREVDQ